MKKSTHEQSHYRAGEGAKRCANCTMFEPPKACTSVDSPVSENGLCDYFEKIPKPVMR